MPLAHAPNIAWLADGVDTLRLDLHLAALEVAAPAILALFVTDMAFGMVASFVPT